MKEKKQSSKKERVRKGGKKRKSMKKKVETRKEETKSMNTQQDSNWRGAFGPEERKKRHNKNKQIGIGLKRGRRGVWIQKKSR